MRQNHALLKFSSECRSWRDAATILPSSEVRVLLIEDDAKTARALASGLRSEGFEPMTANTGEEGFFLLSRESFDFVILDWMLPGRDGIEVLRTLRGRGSKTPVLLLTARDAVDDRVLGLNAGADDYLVKPFAFAELLARVRALTRRELGARPTALVVGDLVLDPASRQVRRGDVEISLSAKQFAILEQFMRRPGEVLSRTDLLEHVWDFAYEGTSNLVDVYV